MSKFTTHYEWDVELHDPESGDVLDHNQQSSFADCLRVHSPEENTQIVLVKTLWDVEIGSLERRTWAYVEDNELPEYFDDGSRVPKRFQAEVSKALSK
jgi:hypothetical protein